MTAYKYINYPQQVDGALYNEATQWVINEFKNAEGLMSLYRFGNITIPGISDLDFLAVFKNGFSFMRSGLENLPQQYQPLFTHRIMAVCEDHFIKNNHYTLWSDHHLLHGEGISLSPDTRTAEEINALKIQTAVEFLIANYIDLKMQITYRTFNLRSFLQHMKGILYDLEYLNISSGAVYNLLLELKHVAQHWFTQTPKTKALDIWINKFDKEYEMFCNKIFHDHPMFLPLMNEYKVARNCRITNGDRLTFHHKGYILPSFVKIMGKKANRLQNRLNSFEFTMPLTHTAPLPVINERFLFLREMKAYNRKYLPELMTITTSITSKII